MKLTAGSLLFVVAATAIFCAHSAKSEVMVDDPDFAEFTVYNSVTGQHPKNGPVIVHPERGDGVFVRLRTKRSCSPVVEVAVHGNVVGEAQVVFRKQFGTVSADTTIEFVWDLCWSPEIVASLRLMDVSKFHKGTMWLDDEGRFLLMPLILERPDLYPVKEGEFLPDPYDYSKVFDTYRTCDNGGIIVLGNYFVYVSGEIERTEEGSHQRLKEIRGESRGGLPHRIGYGHLRWRWLSVWTSDPTFTPRAWPATPRVPAGGEDRG